MLAPAALALCLLAMPARAQLPRLDASGWSITASSTAPWSDAASAIDGHPGTNWRSRFDRFPANLVIDLGETATVDGLDYYSAERLTTRNGHANEFEIAVALDEGEWSTVATGSFSDGPDARDAQKVGFDAIEGRFVRLTILSSHGARHTNVAEVGVFGEVAGAPAGPPPTIEEEDDDCGMDAFEKELFLRIDEIRRDEMPADEYKQLSCNADAIRISREWAASQCEETAATAEDVNRAVSDVYEICKELGWEMLACRMLVRDYRPAGDQGPVDVAAAIAAEWHDAESVETRAIDHPLSEEFGAGYAACELPNGQTRYIAMSVMGRESPVLDPEVDCGMDAFETDMLRRTNEVRRQDMAPEEYFPYPCNVDAIRATRQWAVDSCSGLRMDPPQGISHDGFPERCHEFGIGCHEMIGSQAGVQNVDPLYMSEKMIKGWEDSKGDDGMSGHHGGLVLAERTFEWGGSWAYCGNNGDEGNPRGEFVMIAMAGNAS